MRPGIINIAVLLTTALKCFLKPLTGTPKKRQDYSVSIAFVNELTHRIKLTFKIIVACL